MTKFDIQVTISVYSDTESEAEFSIQDFLKKSEQVVGFPELIDWEFTEFIPTDLKNACCC